MAISRNQFIGKDITVTLGGVLSFPVRVLDVVRNPNPRYQYLITMYVLDDDVLEVLAPYQDLTELTDILIDGTIYSSEITYYVSGICLAVSVSGYTRIRSNPYK